MLVLLREVVAVRDAAPLLGLQSALLVRHENRLALLRLNQARVQPIRDVRLALPHVLLDLLRHQYLCLVLCMSLRVLPLILDRSLLDG